MTDMVNRPPHYNRENAIQCFEEFVMVFGEEAAMYACLFNVWKYRYRSGDKNGIEDIKKSDWYMAKYKELSEKKKHGFIKTCNNPITITPVSAPPTINFDKAYNYKDYINTKLPDLVCEDNISTTLSQK